MRFSLSLPVLRDRAAADPYRQTFELAVLAEELGFDTVTTGHHHFMPGNMSDPLSFLAAVAVRTTRASPQGSSSCRCTIYEQLAAIIRLFGEEVIPAFPPPAPPALTPSGG
jgi:hypothetical protein